MRTHALATRARRRHGGGQAHERQANDVAARFVRGEKRLGRFITPAPAAGFALPASPGVPLASGLRGELEKAFGADLGAVRVHADAPAAIAAQELGARAFASGAHLYFAQGQFRPTSSPGRTILAHEVAHVLQQTGRPGSGNRVRAVDRHGLGETQRWASPLDSTASVPDIPELLHAHLAAVSSSSPHRALIERLLTGYEAASVVGQPAYVTERGMHVLKDSVDPVLGEKPSALPARVASALYDLLKRGFAWRPAATLLHARRDMRTRFFSAETYETYMDAYGADFRVPKARFYRHWYAGGWFGSATPRSMLDRTLRFLLGLGSTITPEEVANGRPLARAFADELKRINSGKMIPDELYFLTVGIAGQVETFRLMILDAALGQVRGFKGYDPEKRAEIKASVAQQLRTIVADARREREKALLPTGGDNRYVYARETALLWFDDVLPALAAVAEYARDFWQGAGLVWRGLTERKPIEGLTGTAADALRRLDTQLPGYRSALDAFLASMLARDAGGGIPEPVAFEKVRDDAVRALDGKLADVLEKPIADALKDALPSEDKRGAFSFDRAAADQRLPPASRMVAAWASLLASELRRLAMSYSRQADEALRARQRTVDPTAAAPDLRLIVRVNLAKKMAEVGRAAHWSDWTDRSRPILQAREPIGGKEMDRDYIAFGTDWQQDPDAATELMLKDLPNEVEGFEPLKTRDIVEFYLTTDYSRFSSHIDRQLQLRARSYDLKAAPVLNEAYAAARAERRPERWLVLDFAYMRPWAEENGRTQFKPRQDFKKLLSEHLLTKALIADTRALWGEEPSWAVNGTVHGGREALVIWLTPMPMQLVARVQAIPEVNRALLGALQGLSDPRVEPTRRAEVEALRAEIESGRVYRWAGTPVAPRAVPIQKLTVPLLQAFHPAPWWALWRAVLSGYPAAKQKELLKAMRQGIEAMRLPAALRAERAEAFERLKLDERRAIAHQRRTVVEKQLRPTLSHFEPYSFAKYDVPAGTRKHRRELATQTVYLLHRFLVHAGDQEERDGHQALALLELSDVVRDQIGGLTRLHELYAWGPLIDEALVWASDAKRGGAPAVRDSFTVPDERGNAALFEQRRANLLAVLTHIAKEFREHFKKWGLVATAGDGTIENPGSVRAVGEDRRFGRGDVLVNEGHTYEVVQVHASFTFHPGAVQFRSLPPAETGGPRLKIGDGPLLPPSEHPRRLLMHVLVDGDPEATAIYADREDDAKLLSQLTWALHMRAIIEQLTALAEAIQTFTEVMMDLAELFPVAGQAIAAARLVGEAMAFIASDIPRIVLQLVKNPAKALEEVWSRMQNLLSLGNLLEYLLFNNHSLNGLIGQRGSGERNPGGSTSRRMKRLAHKLLNLARGAGRVFVRMQDGVQDRRQQVEHFVQGSPRLVRLVQIVADHYFVLANIAEYLSRIPDRDEAIAGFKEVGAELPGHVEEMIASIGRIQLPKEILPLEELIHALIDVVGHRLGGKYKLGVKILLKLLDAVGATDQVVGGMASALRSAGVNTKNIFPLWGNTIVPQVGKRLQSVQTALRNTLGEAFAAFGVDLALAAPKAEVRLEGTEFPEAPADVPAGGAEGGEAQPFMEGAVRAELDRRSEGASLDRARVADLLHALPGAGGEPLSPTTRARAEVTFGQDFSHVRLHRGGAAAEIARSLGARALTSGSHIVMGATPESDPRLLFHELAHVIQQTGARMPGASRTRGPLRGRPGRGLRIDPAAEAAAEAAAAAALGGNARRPRMTGAEGWQPSLIQILGQRFLRQITDIAAIEAEVSEIEKTGAGTGLRLIGKDVRKAVSGVGDNLRANFRPGKNALRTPSRSPYRQELAEISSHLLNSLPEVKDAVEDIAIRASYEAERARGKKPARMALDVGDFKRRLERFVFGKTGILLDLQADTRGRGRDREFKSLKAPFNGAEVKFVFLPPIHGNAKLWQDALEYRGSQRIPQKDRAGWRTGIRAVLRELGPSSSIWVSDAYRLSDKVFRAVEERDRLVQSGALSGTLPPKALPKASEYVNTTAESDTGNGNQRLHLGTYAQKASGQQRGTARESHHITQYLLVEYFHNGSSAKAPETDSERMGFPLLRKYRDRNPYGDGMVQKAGRPQRFGAIQIAELEKVRGAKMPTILLARATHRNGNLHISPRADDVDDTTTATQAGAINAIYKDELPGQQRRIEREVARSDKQSGKEYEPWEEYAKRHDVGSAIEAAMQTTYAYVRNYMQKQLRSALVGIERDYYNDVYLAANPTEKKQPMTRGAMGDVADKAVAHNRDGDKKRGIAGMKDYGWTG